MRRSREDLLVHVSATQHPIENLMVQVSVLTLVIMTILGVVISVILTTRLNRDFEILKVQAATQAGATESPQGLSASELDTDLNYLRWTTYVAVGGGFVILYTGLITISWRAWRTIKNQQIDLLDANVDLLAANQELRDAQERLVRTERLAAIGKLSAGVAHDLRNPLGAIQNAAYYLKGKITSSELLAQNPRVGEFLDIMGEEIESSNQVLADLMDFARVNPPNRSPTQLETVVDSALARTRLKESVQVAKRFDGQPLRVLADSEQLHRVFENLLKNADEAMPHGGTLTIAGRAVDDHAELRLTDTGEGISDGDLAKIMDPLFTTKAKGIGLGLAIVNMIIERHEGTISVASNPGEGATFTIRLPLDGDEEESQDTSDGNR